MIRRALFVILLAAAVSTTAMLIDGNGRARPEPPPFIPTSVYCDAYAHWVEKTGQHESSTEALCGPRFEQPNN